MQEFPNINPPKNNISLNAIISRTPINQIILFSALCEYAHWSVTIIVSCLQCCTCSCRKAKCQHCNVINGVNVRQDYPCTNHPLLIAQLTSQTDIDKILHRHVIYHPDIWVYTPLPYVSPKHKSPALKFPRLQCAL